VCPGPLDLGDEQPVRAALSTEDDQLGSLSAVMAMAASPQALAVANVTSAAVGVTGPIGALSLVFAAAVGAAVVPIAGALTDRFGQERTYRAFALFQLVAAFPIWWALSQGSTVLAIVVISVGLGVGTWGTFGAQSAFMTEPFGARHRYLDVSVAREVSAVLSGGIVPLIGAGFLAAVVASEGGQGTPGRGCSSPSLRPGSAPSSSAVNDQAIPPRFAQSISRFPWERRPSQPRAARGRRPDCPSTLTAVTSSLACIERHTHNTVRAAAARQSPQVSDGKPTRTAGAQRRGAEAVRQPLLDRRSAGSAGPRPSSRRRFVRRHPRDTLERQLGE